MDPKRVSKCQGENIRAMGRFGEQKFAALFTIGKYNVRGSIFFLAPVQNFAKMRKNKNNKAILCYNNPSFLKKNPQIPSTS
jgi:hypothetical protein